MGSDIMRGGGIEGKEEPAVKRGGILVLFIFKENPQNLVQFIK